MRFLVDAQLPPGLAVWLEEQGHQAWHVANLGLADAEDLAVWTRAVELEAILVTKDEDFVAIRQNASRGPAVVWLRPGNATNRVLIGWLAKAFLRVIAALDAGDVVIEVR